jgi:ABC-2 type transport system permease protein
MIEARGLTRRYGRAAAAAALSFEVWPGRVSGFLGMTAATRPRVPLGRYWFSQVARMKWAKVRTLRSASWILLILAAGMIGLAILVLSQYPSDWAHMSAAGRASFAPAGNGFARVALGQLTMGVLGVLVITSEYSSGMIRATLSAVPRRGMPRTAKAAVLGTLVLPAAEILAFAVFLAGQAVLTAPAPHASLGQPGVLRAVLMSGAYLFLIGLIGLGFGAIIRHTAGAVGAIAGVVFALLLVLLALPASVRQGEMKFLPGVIAGNSLAAVKPAAYSLAPWAGLGLLCLYAVVALGAGGWLMMRRDA